MDQGKIQNLKCHYTADFIRKLINEGTSVKEFQNNFTIKDSIFSVDLAWNAVKPVTLRRRWRKLWPSVKDADGSSDEEDFEGFNVRPAQTTSKQILETVKAAHTDNPLTKLQENEIEEWIEIDTGAEVTETITDEQIIDSAENLD
jgi:hypothetical protein